MDAFSYVIPGGTGQRHATESLVEIETIWREVKAHLFQSDTRIP